MINIMATLSDTNDKYKSDYINLCDIAKQINDVIHGNIQLSKFAIKIIDTIYFQRLRDLSQLGLCKYVFPNANHTRFEHSIGTYYLCGKILNTIINNTKKKDLDKYLSEIPELQQYFKNAYDGKKHSLDIYVCELIKIASLCHDIGHGPLSHLFDDIYLPAVSRENNQYSTHEERSKLLLKLIISQCSELSQIVSDDEISFMTNLINPKKEHTGFIYQIVSNKLTNLDVDKFDYLERDIYFLGFDGKISTKLMTEQIKIINNNIVYPEQAINNIRNLFSTRHRLHRYVYGHKSVIAIDLMFVEIFKLIDNIFDLSNNLSNMDEFAKLTESYIINSIKYLHNNINLIEEHKRENVKNAYTLLNKIENRQLYTSIYQQAFKQKINITKLESYISRLEDAKFISVFQRKIGYTNSDINDPLDNIEFYKTKDVHKSYNLISYKKYDYDTTLIPMYHQEYLVHVFYKLPNDNKKRINDLNKYFVNLFSNKISNLIL